jgi:hypothetical protein
LGDLGTELVSLTSQCAQAELSYGLDDGFLAFELPPACAFHICRGTAPVMLKYYEHLASHAWQLQKKDWKIYIEQLTKEGRQNGSPSD